MTANTPSSLVMKEYHKIDSVFKRNPEDKYKSFLMGDYTKPAFCYLANSIWTGTEKVDGTNCRISTEGIGGRTDKAELHKDLTLALLDIQASMIVQDLVGITLYGEGYGAGIQSGGHYRPDKAFVLFDVLTDTGRWLDRDDVEGIAAQLQIPVVPILAEATLLEWVGIISTGGFSASVLHEGGNNEGVVLRPSVELRDARGGRVITKLKYRDFA